MQKIRTTHTPEVEIQHPPSRLVLNLTSECNLHCKHCHMWTNRDSDHSLTLGQMQDAVRQFSLLNPEGMVFLCGGELMLKEDMFISLSSLCHDLGLTSIAVTNGSLVSKESSQRIIESGLNVLVFSIDSHIEEIHNWVRGSDDSFTAIGDAIRNLNMERSKSNSKIKIITNTVLFDTNIHTVKEFISFARKIGVDGVRFQCLQPTFFNASKGKDNFYERFFFRDKTRSANEIDEIRSMYSEDPFVLHDNEDFFWMKTNIEREDNESPYPVCDSFNKIVQIEHDGRYSLCPNMHLVDGVGHIGNFKDTNIESFWYGHHANSARSVMMQCKKSCGMISGYRKGTITP